jgi:hypothetical protein
MEKSAVLVAMTSTSSRTKPVSILTFLKTFLELSPFGFVLPRLLPNENEGARIPAPVRAMVWERKFLLLSALSDMRGYFFLNLRKRISFSLLEFSVSKNFEWIKVKKKPDLFRIRLQF